MDALRGATALVAACMGSLCLSAGAQAPRPVGMVVGADEQAARDTERVRILRDELAREQTAAADAAMRRAAEQDEQGQQRAAENIAALRRELDAALREQAGAKTASAAVRSRAARSTTTAATPVRWWDVYAKPPRRAVIPSSPSPLPVRATPADAPTTLPNR